MYPEDNSRTGVPDSHIIRRYDAEGKNPTEIAELLGITAQSVRNVLSGFAEKGQFIDLEVQVLEEIRHSNCPDQKWPVAQLLNVFRFSTRVRRTIEHYCEGNAIAVLSLRDLFEFFISDELPPNPGFVITPFLDFRNGGEKSCWEAVDRITILDMGQSANAIWNLKIKRLEQANRIKGPRRHSWSKPVRSGK